MVGVPALVALGLYWPVLKLPLIYDTLLHIRITSELNWGTVWWPTPSFGFYRPMTFVPLLLVKDLFDGYPAWLLQGMNWLQHGLNVALLAGLLLRLRPRRPHLALFAGLLMAVFPFSYQALAVYGHNVHPAIVGLFLVGLHLYVRARGGELVGTQGNSGELSEQLTVNSEQLAVNSEQLPVTSDQSLSLSVSQSPVSSLQSPATHHVSHLARWLPTFFVFVLALLTHESAVLFGALAGLVEGAAGGWWLAVGRWPLAAGEGTHFASRITQFIRYALRSPWFVFLVLGGVYFGLYQFLPISRAPQGVDVAAASLTLRLLYVTQAAAYPFAWLAQWWPEQGIAVLLVGAAATLLLTLNALRYPAHRLPLLLGWGWFGLAVLVIAIPLPTDYLLHGPRLLYLSSVGLAVVWAVVLDGTRGNSGELGGTQAGVNSEQLAVNSNQLPVTSDQSLSLSVSQSPVSSLQSLVSLLFLAFILFTNIAFVRGRLADYGRLTGGVKVVAEAMADKPAEVGITLVNLPQWLGQPSSTYPVGAELAQMLGGYLFAEELMVHNLGVDHPTLAVVVPELLQPTAYPYAVHDQHSLRQLDELPLAREQHFFLTRYLEAGPVLSHVGWVREANAAATPIASFAVYDLLAAQAQNCDDTVQVTLVWQARGEIPATTSVFVQLLAPAGELLAQADGPPLSLPPEMGFWRGRELHDIRPLAVPPGQQPGQTLVGVYDYLTAARYPAISAEGQPLPDNAFVVPLTPCTH